MKNNSSTGDYLKIESINKEYKRGKVKANNNITTAFYPGQVAAVIGHNGAGKTTLLNQIVGVVKPDSGDIRYQEYSLVKDTKIARELVSMMPQFHAPLNGVTIRQSVEAILRLRCITGRQVKERTEKILSELDIKQWANQVGNKLSGGLQRLTSFAMAVVAPTPIILLDEPTNDIDPVRRKLVWNYMKKLARDGHIVIVVTHNLLEVELYADRFLLFNKGRLIKDAPTADLKQLASNTLTVVVNDSSVMREFTPDALESKYYDKEAKAVFALSSQQVPAAICQMLKMIEEGKIVNYRLSPTSLDVSYGGMMDEE
ncbi:ABC transporter ATP-binding protein [Herbinix luporum]|jgi:ABC-2 type transport system ATP-binding protein|uniref:ABC transporter domain-containing protein n=1 Tax=Herbinix luporum TaxID=1679721 RepID=A0A0K8J7J0_9FIRM|nr:ATP-binding cassette domain-containing protein [Herbinix luporum]MDI9489725.1 ATP-binding cassette domain-containing protein [Bacillota bacterium]CUH93626.1 hypothetical protein SD1D_2090 [Herbinix luporum]HHT56893.1 ATP-binding cassette domain-containing protein [Herbinix luporum]